MWSEGPALSRARIGLDYWPATTHAPGIGRYARELVRALVQRAEAPYLCLFDAGPGPRTVPEDALGLPSGSQRVRRVDMNIHEVERPSQTFPLAGVEDDAPRRTKIKRDLTELRRPAQRQNLPG